MSGVAGAAPVAPGTAKALMKLFGTLEADPVFANLVERVEASAVSLRLVSSWEVEPVADSAPLAPIVVSPSLE